MNHHSLKTIVLLTAITTTVACLDNRWLADNCVELYEYSCCATVNTTWQLPCGSGPQLKFCPIYPVSDNQVGLVIAAIIEGWVGPAEIPIGNAPCRFHSPKCTYNPFTGKYECGHEDFEMEVYCVDEDLPGGLNPCTP